MFQSAALLSPIPYVGQMTSPLAINAADNFLAEAMKWLGIHEFNPRGQNCCLNSSAVSFFQEHEPQSSSTKNMVHVAQRYRSKLHSSATITQREESIKKETDKKLGEDRNSDEINNILQLATMRQIWTFAGIFQFLVVLPSEYEVEQLFSSCSKLGSRDDMLSSNSMNNVSASSQENGFVDSLSSLNSEKAVQEMIKPLVQGTDDHLIEFSEVMRSMPMFTSYMCPHL